MKFDQQQTGVAVRNGGNLRFRRSAGFQPAVSPTSSRQGVEGQKAVGTSERLADVPRLQIGNPRYSRLEVRATLLWFASVTLMLLAGCAVGPNYQRPAAVATMPAAYAGANIEWKVATPQAHLPKGAWWEIFDDAELNRLEQQAAVANQELQAAVARFAQARASADVARSGLFPRVGAGFAATRQRDSANRPLSNTGQAAGAGYTYDNFTIPFDFSYELDCWGRVRRQVESARASVQANAADLEGVRLAIAAEVAADYFTLRALDAEKAALADSIEADRKALELTRNRRALGLVSDLDVAQADTVCQIAEAQLPALTLKRAQFEHALAALTGQPATLFKLPATVTSQSRQRSAGFQPAVSPASSRPDDECQPPVGISEHLAESSPQRIGNPRDSRLEVCATSPMESPLPIIPAELPSALLERRPDIAAAERRMAAANANIGVSKAAYFPTLRLNGLAGFQSIDAGTFFDWPSRLWAIGPSLTLPLFEGGQRRANLRGSEAAYAETVARYRQTVLTAFAEVEDNLAAQRLLTEQYRKERAAWQSARKQLAVAENRYQSGLIGYLPVATAQTTALEQERVVAQLRGQQIVAAIALIKSLGGGWRSAEPADAAVSTSLSDRPEPPAAP
jgi:multidrug efflux system outer membrane protein